MCGIAGLYSSVEPITLAHVDLVRRMGEAQAHRGPDDSGIHQEANCVLGHQRLAILDLSAKGHQPMGTPDQSTWVSFNGEIYNYVDLKRELISLGYIFASSSDTEVLVHGYRHWGIEGLLERLSGMFAFAIYDRKLGLILARDRLGIKPLYYFQSGECLLFASEVKSLLRSGVIPCNANADAYIGFLLAGSVPAPLTTIQGLESLLPGHYLVANRDGQALRKYWDLESGAGSWSRLSQDEDLASLLEETVARHLLSDVPVGIFLSGGVDSAALVALASRVKRVDAPALKTLTVTFDEQEFSEGSPAAQIAAAFGTEHQEVRVTAADFVREIPAFFGAMDQPTNDGVNTYFVSRAARRAGLTVVLSGLGGDEVFWGYRHYPWIARWAKLLERCPPLIRRSATQIFSLVGKLRGRENWRRTSYIGKQVSTGSLYLMFRGFFAAEQVASLLGANESQVNDVAQKYFSTSTDEVSPAAFNRLEFRRYLHDQLLRDTDIFSMAHSIEARVPLLDHRVVEYVSRMNPASKLCTALNKPLLVNSVDHPLVRQAASRSKRGFSFPMDRWMKARVELLEEMSNASSVLNRGTASAAWELFRNGRLHWSRAWALAVLGGRN